MQVRVYIFLLLVKFMIQDIGGENPLCPRASRAIPSMCISECQTDEDCALEHGDHALCCHGGCRKEDPKNRELNTTYMSCLPPDICSTGVCKHGECIKDATLGYRCICDAGYTDDNCSSEIDSCKSAYCMNGGTCENLLGNYTCCCPPGYTGRHCEQVIVHCGSKGKPKRSPCSMCKKYKNAICITKIEYYIVKAGGEMVNVTDECIKPR